MYSTVSFCIKNKIFHHIKYLQLNVLAIELEGKSKSFKFLFCARIQQLRGIIFGYQLESILRNCGCIILFLFVLKTNFFTTSKSLQLMSYRLSGKGKEKDFKFLFCARKLEFSKLMVTSMQLGLYQNNSRREADMSSSVQ